MSLNILDLVVRGADGAVDMDASCDKFRGALSAALASSESQTAEIATAVHAVFEEHKGLRMAVPTVVSLTLGKMSCSAETWAEKSKLVHGYVTSNAAFNVKKGKGGGVARIADLPPTETK